MNRIAVQRRVEAGSFRASVSGRDASTISRTRIHSPIAWSSNDNKGRRNGSKRCRHADDGASPRFEHASDFFDGAFGFVEGSIVPIE